MTRMAWMSGLFLLLAASVVSAADVKAEVTALLEKQNAAWNRGDLEGYMSAYDQGPELVFMGSSGPIRDWKVIKDRYEKRYRSKTGADLGKLTFSRLEVEALAGRLARAWGRWEVVQGEKKSGGWFTLILKKGPSGWKIIHDHSSSDQQQ